MNEGKYDTYEKLNALADGSLNTSQSEGLLEEIEQDAELREILCDIHRLKDMVRYAYAESEPPQRHHRLTDRFRLGVSVAAAAVVLFSLGFVGGRLTLPNDPLAPFELTQVVSQPNKVMLFVGHSDADKFKQALDRAEQLLIEYEGQGAEVNVVTSAGGIDLLRTASSPYLQRVKNLSENYAAIQFVACNNTIARLAREGKDVALINNTVVKPSAVQFLVERLQQGWSYVAI
jgi:intracellular sulfur oxidation DsrE/DsrF family protein